MKPYSILIILTSALLLTASCGKQTTEEPPNVIYLLFDDLGYGDLSCYGQDKLQTPNIDRLAAEGMRFTQHYSGNTVCSPSRACLMTGQHPGRVYLRGNLKMEKGAELDTAMVVLPELFQKAGYATGAFGKWGLGRTSVEGPPNPLNHGFVEFYGWKSQTIAHTYYPSSMVHNGQEIPRKEGEYAHDLVMEHAFDFIRRNASSGTPFFCYIPVAVPHAAMHAPAGLHEKWRQKLPQFDTITGTYRAGPDEDCPDVVNPIAGFAAMMENIDNQVGEMMALLQELGISQNTLVMVSSDNGAHLEGGHDPWFWDSNGPLRGHKRDLYEGGIRAPFIVRWPGKIAAGSVSDHVSAFWDVFPTMAALLGEEVPEQARGISFLPELLGDSTSQEETPYLYWEFCKGPDQKIWSQAVRMGDWKYVKITGNHAGPVSELYHLADDLAEEKDLSEQYPGMVEKAETIILEARIPRDSQ